jgi:hypothetical protein
MFFRGFSGNLKYLVFGGGVGVEIGVRKFIIFGYGLADDVFGKDVFVDDRFFKRNPPRPGKCFRLLPYPLGLNSFPGGGFFLIESLLVA